MSSDRIFSDIMKNLDYEEIEDLILRLDNYICDYDVTLSLVKKLCKEITDEDKKRILEVLTDKNVYAVVDRWHPECYEKGAGLFFSNDPCFEGDLEQFYGWIEQHGGDRSEAVKVEYHE